MTTCARRFFFLWGSILFLFSAFFSPPFFWLWTQASVSLYLLHCGTCLCLSRTAYLSVGTPAIATIPTPLSPPQWLDQRMACHGPQSHCVAKEFTTVKSLMGFSSELFHWATATLSLPCCKGFRLCWDGSYPDMGTKAWEHNRGRALYLKEGGERGRGGVREVGHLFLR